MDPISAEKAQTLRSLRNCGMAFIRKELSSKVYGGLFQSSSGDKTFQVKQYCI